MAQAKTSAFDPALVRTAALAKALAHPVRIRILEILAGRRGCVCGGLVDLLPLAQSTVSQHLKELRDAGLIRGDARRAPDLLLSRRPDRRRSGAAWPGFSAAFAQCRPPHPARSAKVKKETS